MPVSRSSRYVSTVYSGPGCTLKNSVRLGFLTGTAVRTCSTSMLAVTPMRSVSGLNGSAAAVSGPCPSIGGDGSVGPGVGGCRLDIGLPFKWRREGVKGGWTAALIGERPSLLLRGIDSSGC